MGKIHEGRATFTPAGHKVGDPCANTMGLQSRGVVSVGGRDVAQSRVLTLTAKTRELETTGRASEFLDATVLGRGLLTLGGWGCIQPWARAWQGVGAEQIRPRWSAGTYQQLALMSASKGESWATLWRNTWPSGPAGAVLLDWPVLVARVTYGVERASAVRFIDIPLHGSVSVQLPPHETVNVDALLAWYSNGSYFGRQDSPWAEAVALAAVSEGEPLVVEGSLVDVEQPGHAPSSAPLTWGGIIERDWSGPVSWQGGDVECPPGARTLELVVPQLYGDAAPAAAQGGGLRARLDAYGHLSLPRGEVRRVPGTLGNMTLWPEGASWLAPVLRFDVGF